MYFSAPKAILILALGVVAFLPIPAIAVDSPLNAPYARLLENPGNRQLNLDYAALAMQHKDYESAIPPLERILMSEPGNAKIRLQIGILYHLLGSKVIAKEYFLEAKSTPGAPAVVVQEAEGYLHGL